MAVKKSTVVMATPELFKATGYTGAVVPIHLPKEGDVRLGPGPMEMVVLAAGGCTMSDVVDILKKQREDITRLARFSTELCPIRENGDLKAELTSYFDTV